ncbi:E3 ubiquitin-protein ligase znrf2-like [Chanos chanos]|uniref:RING-type E3 ubiquitin transferase n=1 Tax=Chanos chanos TaxID=29144 RepID=A0A6J2WGF0_CHACN|nr:E3 ubiquitin-protein ligase znrf2-like [Chanos chanos]
MGPKQSCPAESGRVRAYSSSDVPSSRGNGSDGPALLRYYNGRTSGDQQIHSGGRFPAGNRPNSLVQSAVIQTSRGSRSQRDHSDGERNGEPRLLIGSLPAHLSPHLLGAGFHCPVCSKYVSSNEVDSHLIMCLTKPRLTYNDDVLTKDSGECSICLDDMVQGDTIARLPCLCIYHKGCIDEWFEVNRSCPEHPLD